MFSEEFNNNQLGSLIEYGISEELKNRFDLASLLSNLNQIYPQSLIIYDNPDEVELSKVKQELEQFKLVQEKYFLPNGEPGDDQVLLNLINEKGLLATYPNVVFSIYKSTDNNDISVGVLF